MPWLAVPYAARSAQAAMASRFKVQGIPALVLIENGEVINASARGAVMKDPKGAEFPWRGQEDPARCVQHSSSSRNSACTERHAQRHAGLYNATTGCIAQHILQGCTISFFPAHRFSGIVVQSWSRQGFWMLRVAM